MASYNGRRGPNVSQYLRDLNAINRQETGQEEPFNMEEDLALFTNTQFFDFETGQNTDYQAQAVKADGGEPATSSTSPSEGMTPAQSAMGELSSLDFIQGELPCRFFFPFRLPIKFLWYPWSVTRNHLIKGLFERHRQPKDWLPPQGS